MGGRVRLLSFLKLSFLYIGAIDFVNIRTPPSTGKYTKRATKKKKKKPVTFDGYVPPRFYFLGFQHSFQEYLFIKSP